MLAREFAALALSHACNEEKTIVPVQFNGLRKQSGVSLKQGETVGKHYPGFRGVVGGRAGGR